MFLRKLTVIAVPLGMLILLCLLMPLFASASFFGCVLLGCLLGIALALLLPLAGATRMREPFAHLLWIPAVVVLAVLFWQYLSLTGVRAPLLDPLATTDGRVFLIEGAFMAYMITFSVRTGRGV